MDSISNICEKCNKAFKNRHHLLRHIRAIHEGKSYKCSTCMKEFNRLENLKRHMEKHQKQPLESTDINLHSSKRVKLSEPIHHAEISKPIQQIPHQYSECNWCGQIKELLLINHTGMTYTHADESVLSHSPYSQPSWRPYSWYRNNVWTTHIFAFCHKIHQTLFNGICNTLFILLNLICHVL